MAVRWGLATLALVLVTAAESMYGHAAALGLLVTLLLIVAVFGGTRSRRQ